MHIENESFGWKEIYFEFFFYLFVDFMLRIEQDCWYVFVKL